MPHRAFTTKYKYKARVLTTEVGLFLPITQEEALLNPPTIKKYIAIWDTGATGTVITKKVANELGIQPTGITEVQHAGGISQSNTYLINVTLPNEVTIQGVKVTEGVLAEGAPVLIGMDIIGLGDFAVSHCNEHGGTTMSFCIPSSEEIDFIPQSQEKNIIEGGNRHARRALLKQKRNK